MRGALTAIAALLVFPVLTRASPPSSRHADPPASAGLHLSPQDRRFLERAAENNLVQIELAEVAMQQGKTERLRDFSQKIIDDRAQANDRLEQIATRAGVSLPTGLSDEQKLVQDRLWQASDRDFGRAYLREVKRTQRQAISAFRQQARHGRNRELKSFARSMLPTLERTHRLASRPSLRM